jgi:predicted metal-dependent phosphoesterase TrpH
MSTPPLASGGRWIDLHAHTIFSDGLLEPEALVARARDKGLVALAITDHDSIEALPRALAGAQASLEVVPGIELSTSLEGADLHVLGYYLNPENAALRQRLERFKEERRARVEAIADRLASLGAPIDVARVFELAGPGVVGRPHVAQVLVESGHVTGQDEAFKRFLGLGGPAFVPRPSFTPFEAIELIHAADGVSVLAHPGGLPDAWIERLAAAGLRGIEVWHPHHGAATVRRHRALARRLHLLETGGSDFHGERRSADLGEIQVPASVLATIKEAAGVSG